jgi:hypothetical protein
VISFLTPVLSATAAARSGGGHKTIAVIAWAL